jgi:uncharacterized hydrophobic protein (TIGR00271 family)
VLSLTLLAPPSRSQSVIDVLTALDGVHTVVRVPAAAVESGDDLLSAAVEPAVADLVLERLAAAGVPGERITLSRSGIGVAEIGRRQDEDLWDEGADAVVWEEVLEEAAEDSRLSLTYLVTMAIAGFIASIGVYDDQPVLIVGAMALSPDLAHLSALSVGLVCRRPGIAGRAAATLLAGLGIAAAVRAATVAIASGIGYAPEGGGFGRGVLTSFITNPGVAGAAVALAGGVAAMLSFERRSAGAAVGVAISVTTIPAAAGLGVAIGLTDLDRALGALGVLAINLSCLTAGAVATAWLQRRRSSPRSISSRRRSPRGPSHSSSPSGS